MRDIIIIKADGAKAIFNKQKLMASLTNSGASSDLAQRVADQIESELVHNTTTRVIYKKAFKLLKNLSEVSASKYKLKRAILQLGPSGYPFEKFIGEFLKHQGFTTKVGVIVQGNCVQHEVDVIAEKDQKHFMVECKFHSSFSTKCSVKIPLYIQSRFLDIEKAWINQIGHKHKLHQGWVVNNTRFTEDAVQYSKCVGLKLLSWDYPPNKGIKTLITKMGLYPITCLLSLSKKEKQQLLARDIVLCKNLCNQPKILESINIDARRQKKIIFEANNLCNSKIV